MLGPIRLRFGPFWKQYAPQRSWRSLSCRSISQLQRPWWLKSLLSDRRRLQHTRKIPSRIQTPKTVPNSAWNTARFLSDLLVFLVLFNVIVWYFWGFNYSKNGELMIIDGSQHFLAVFWNFQKFHQIWTRAPRIYHQRCFNVYEKIMESFAKDIIFHISTFWKYKFPKWSTLPNINNLELIFWFFEIMKFWNWST